MGGTGQREAECLGRACSPDAHVDWFAVGAILLLAILLAWRLWIELERED